ncbi:hypothetical protein V8Z80_08555 [Orrella sp. JC864]|uniref:hypothetical protein n=1 Tax=Orrella sp. JC864 TaxID=3120298 RepID=UPI00300BA754
MTIPVWTGTAPTTQYGRQPKAPFLRTEMDNGTSRNRARFRVYPITISVNFFFDQEEYDRWQRFCEEELVNYSGWFMLMTTGPGGARLRRVQWVAPPKEDMVGTRHWRITGQVETLSNA